MLFTILNMKGNKLWKSDIKEFSKNILENFIQNGWWYWTHLMHLTKVWNKLMILMIQQLKSKSDLRLMQTKNGLSIK